MHLKSTKISSRDCNFTLMCLVLLMLKSFLWVGFCEPSPLKGWLELDLENKNVGSIRAKDSFVLKVLMGNKIHHFEK